MDLFPAFESDFRDVHDSVRAKVSEIPNASGDKKWELAREAENELAEAEELLQTMSLGVKNVAPGTQRDQLNKRVATYEGQLAELQKDLKRSQIAYGSKDRENLLSGGGAHSDLNITADDDRARLLEATNSMRRDNDVLEDAVRAADRAVATGADTMVELDVQTGTIQRGIDRLHNTQNQISEAENVMNKMLRVALQNKLLIAVICIVLVVAIGIILYLKFR